MGSGGVIPYSSILSGQGSGEAALIKLSALIMLTMLLIIAIMYMVSYVFGLDFLKRMANVEFGELLVTGLVVFLFLGSWNLAAASTSSTTFLHVAGTNFGRNIYVEDCTYLAPTSIGLIIGPMLLINVARLILNTAISLKITIEPSFFGVAFSPLKGYTLLDSVLGTLSTITGGFVITILAVLVFIGFVYGLFPVFLYAGIVLRTLPWTRAAGGAFLGLFVGFYIVFPLALHLLLSGYVTALQTTTINSNPTAFNAFIVGIAAGAAGGGSSTVSSILSTLASAATNFIGTSAGGSFGLINGYIFYVIEPASFTIFAIIISLILAFEFTEMTGRILGAPSVSAQNIISRIVK